MNSYYVIEFVKDWQDNQTGEFKYEKGRRIIAWVFDNNNYVVANTSDIEYIDSDFVKKIYKVKFEELEGV